jgi:hypothetical protein
LGAFKLVIDLCLLNIPKMLGIGALNITANLYLKVLDNGRYQETNTVLELSRNVLVAAERWELEWNYRFLSELSLVVSKIEK